MSDAITVTIRSNTIANALQKLIRQGQNLHPVLNAIGHEMETRVRARFETKTDPAGHPWAALKPSTRKKYDREDRGARRGSLLDREGHMLDSLNYQVEGDGVRIGFGAPYAIYHEYGTKHMERRGMLAGTPGGMALDQARLGADDERAVVDLVRSYFLQTD